MRSLLVITDAWRLAAARVFARWRPLLWFWLTVLSVTIAGGAVLHYLGPPSERPSPNQVLSEPRRSAPPAKPEPPPMAASASAVVPAPVTPLPRQPDPEAPSPPQSHPAPDPQAPGGADQGGIASPSQPLIILHPARSDSGSVMAEHLASRLGLADDQVATGAIADAVPRAIIRFYSAEDHPLARRLGTELAQMGYAWQIENYAERPSSAGHQPLEIWLPRR